MPSAILVKLQTLGFAVANNLKLDYHLYKEQLCAAKTFERKSFI